MKATHTPERSISNLWRGLVGWPLVVIAVAGVVAYFGTMEWGDNLVLLAVLGAFIAVPIGLIGLAVTSDSTGEKVVIGIVAALIVLFDAAFLFLVLVLSQVP